MSKNDWLGTWPQNCATLLFYLGYAALMAFMEKLMPSNRCNPGTGMLLLLALPFISGGLLFKNAFQLLALRQPRLVAVGLHLTVCVVFGACSPYSL